MHRLAAVACLAAGIGVLAGPGWALLALGVLLWGTGPRRQREDAEQPQAPLDEALVRARDLAAQLRGGAVRALEKPRRTTAVASMVAGIAGVPAGVLLVAGTGAAILAGAGLLIGVSLLAGWNA